MAELEQIQPLHTTTQATPQNPVDTYIPSETPEGPRPRYIPKRIAIPLLIVIVCGFLIGAVLNFKSIFPAKNDQSAAGATTTSSPSEKPAPTLKTYKSKHSPFSFQYPESYFTVDSDIKRPDGTYSTTVYVKPLGEKEPGLSKNGGISIVITPGNSGLENSLSKKGKRIKFDLPEDASDVNDQQVVLNSIPARKITFKSGDKNNEYYGVHLYIINATADIYANAHTGNNKSITKEEIEGILATFNFQMTKQRSL